RGDADIRRVLVLANGAQAGEQVQRLHGGGRRDRVLWLSTLPASTGRRIPGIGGSWTFRFSKFVTSRARRTAVPFGARTPVKSRCKRLPRRVECRHRCARHPRAMPSAYWV